MVVEVGSNEAVADGREERLSTIIARRLGVNWIEKDSWSHHLGFPSNQDTYAS